MCTRVHVNSITHTQTTYKLASLLDYFKRVKEIETEKKEAQYKFRIAIINDTNIIQCKEHKPNLTLRFIFKVSTKFWPPHFM